ncbi:RlpA-like double-psi beta-barrel-protein domain-containing protein-containing protein [Mrakia frigida]|uniref:RlpA-like double-psi beta-barrel domain-containing protein n=1 Tax=Mrakia frigida TaxID=29902 RepID=UPI003FCC0C64
MLSLAKILLPALLLLLPSTLAFPKGGNDEYYREHTPALLRRSRLPPSHAEPHKRAVQKRRQAKRAVCPASSGSASATITSSAVSASATPTASASASAISSIGAQQDDGTSTIFSTRTSTVWTTMTASSTSTGTAATATSTGSTSVSVDAAGDGPFDGNATWFYTGLGACGWTNTSSDLIVAVSSTLFDSWPGYAGTNPNDNPICGNQLLITYGDQTVLAQVADRCTTCGERSLDLTQGAFQALVPGGLDVGIVPMTWSWVN